MEESIEQTNHRTSKQTNEREIDRKYLTNEVTKSVKSPKLPFNLVKSFLALKPFMERVKGINRMKRKIKFFDLQINDVPIMVLKHLGQFNEVLN